MANRTLSATFIAKLPPREDSYEVSDRMPGFGVRVHKTGKKVFCASYRHPVSKVWVRITIGSTELYGLEEAREKAKDILKQVRDGNDPRRQLQVRRASTPALTMQAQLELYSEFLYANRPRSARERLRVLRKDYGPLLHCRVDEIKKRDVVEVIDRLVQAKKPSAARHAFANGSAFFSWMADRDVIPSSPFASMKQLVSAQRRQRVLSDAELRSLWGALDVMGYPYGPVCKLLIATGQRRSEVGGMRWEDIDIVARHWTMPRHLNKSDRTHLVPLNNVSLEIIGDLPRLDDTWVFPGTTNSGPINGWSKWKAELDGHLPEMAHWVIHDLRRTVYSQLGRLKVLPDIKERIVNHSRPRLQEIYDLYEYEDEKRVALDAWGARLASLVQPQDEPGKSVSAAGRMLRSKVL